MSTIVTRDRISHILDLVGPALLLPWAAGSKGGRRKWKHLQLTDMNDDKYLAELNKAGNIGVALGAVSNGLVTIDLDQDSYVDAILAANPLLRNTLRTHAARGCNIWVRCSGGYAPSQKLKNSSADEIGEWRADGNQTIISGIHREGKPYQFVVEHPVITISYDAIIWPESILPPHATESQRVRGEERVRRGKEQEVVCTGPNGQIQKWLGSAALIAQIAPTDIHQNNASLFKLARLVKSYENAIGRAATEEELEAIFDRWCLIAHRFWRPGLTRDDYYAEFLEACSYARIGLDQNPIELAVSRAKAAPLPQVQGFKDERIRLLVAICREMQAIIGANPFFLPTRKLGEILGAHYTQVARWLRALAFLQIIHLAPGEVRKPGGNRSPRYHYGRRHTCKVCVPPTLLPLPQLPALLTTSHA